MGGAELLESTQRFLGSTAAQQIYFVVGMGLIISFSVYVAYQQAQEVTGQPTKLTFLGRKPTRSASIKRRLEIAEGFRSQLLIRLLGWFILVVLWGVLIPATALAVFSVNYNWLYPDSYPFVASSCREACRGVSGDASDIAIYVLSQTSTALALDVFSEFLGLPEPKIVHNDANTGFAGLMFVFRLYMQFYVANWLRTTGLGVYNWFMIPSEEHNDLIRQLKADYAVALKREGREQDAKNCTEPDALPAAA